MSLSEKFLEETKELDTDAINQSWFHYETGKKMFHGKSQIQTRLEASKVLLFKYLVQEVSFWYLTLAPTHAGADITLSIYSAFYTEINSMIFRYGYH